MANYYIKPTGTQTPGLPDLEKADGVLYVTLLLPLSIKIINNKDIIFIPLK